MGVFWYNIITFTITKEGRFNQLAVLKIIRACVLLLMLFIFSKFQIFGIILSLMLSVVMPVFFYFYIGKCKIIDIFKEVTLKVKLLKTELVKNYQASVQASFNVINLQFFAFYIVAFESTKIIASYFFMEKIINAPLNLLASTLRQVIYKYFVENQNNFSRLFLSYIRIQFSLSFISFLFGAVIYFYSEELILLVLGQNWTEVALLLNAYILVVMMQIINIPCTSLYLAIDKIYIVAHLEKLDLAIKILFVFISIFNNWNVYDFIKFTSFYIFLYYCIVNGFAYRILLRK
jgi:O-antigen/teichoic acid export membrane protein